MAEKEQLSENQEKYGYDTNIENVQQSMAVQTYKKELAIKRILDNDIYSFKNALLILNPYKISLLTAVLLFNTEMQCMVRYVIKGIRGSKDYTVCDETYTTRHRVPITGLYENAYNIVQVYLLYAEKKGTVSKEKGNFENLSNAIAINEYEESDDVECFENRLPVIVRIVGDLLQIYGRDHLVKKHCKNM